MTIVKLCGGDRVDCLDRAACGPGGALRWGGVERFSRVLRGIAALEPT